jgi:hypothetical protein
MKKLLVSLALCAAGTTAANAVIVDGTLDAAYGTAKSVVAYNSAAPNSNFGAPTGEAANIGYSIYLAAANGYVYGYLKTNAAGGGTSAGAFANLYWDIDPGPYNGTDIGFELSATTQNFFIPGGTNYGHVSGITVAVSADGSGLEFSIPNSFFTTAITGVSYTSAPSGTIGDEVTLGLSQSFGYSVAGGAAAYGADRLGSVILAAPAAVPEPMTWAMMVGGFGLVGAAMRRRTLGLTFG